MRFLYGTENFNNMTDKAVAVTESRKHSPGLETLMTDDFFDRCVSKERNTYLLKKDKVKSSQTKNKPLPFIQVDKITFFLEVRYLILDKV